MRPIDKTSEDLFQKLRSRFSPISMGDENADETATPNEARIFNFMYKDGENEAGYISISIIDNRSFKVYYGTDLVEKIENKDEWYSFLKELRMFAKRNLMSFDARDLSKNQLEPRDFKFISRQDGTYKEHEVSVSESIMFGSRRKSYQTMENAKMIVHHRKSVDEAIPGSRSRYIESIFIENADGERYKFPYNYLTGARVMTRHVNEGGNPYDDVGKHIVGMVKEMRDLSKFARRTKKHAMEDENAGNIRNSVVERFHNMKKQLGAMSVKEGYDRFVEGFKTEEALVEDDAVQQIKERFTQQVFDTQLEDTLPAVMKAIREAEMRQVAEADKSIPMLIKKNPLVLRKDDAADQMFLNTKFTDGAGLLSFILSDIASRAIGDNADEIANFASDASERIQDRDYDQNDKQTAMHLAKKYMDDVRKSLSDPSYKDQVRMDPKHVYGKMKKREGGFHESEAYEAWANELVPETSVNEVSRKAATSAYASANDPSYTHPKADAIRGHIERKFGQDAANDADAHSYATHFGRGTPTPGKDSTDGGMRQHLSKNLTKSGKVPQGTQSAMKSKIKDRNIGGPKGTLPEDYDSKAAADAKQGDEYLDKHAGSANHYLWSVAYKKNQKNKHKAVTGMDTDQVPESNVKKKSHNEVGEATTQGTIGTTGTSGPAALAQNLKDKGIGNQAKLAAQALKTGGVQNVNAPTVARTLAKQASSMPLNKKDMEPVAALGAKAMQAATNPKVANQLGALLKKAGI